VDYDDIVIGSGLSALATVIGLPPGRRVLVIAGPGVPQTLYYDATSAVPCAHVGYGGLGNFWHGVIPTGGRENFARSSAAEFEQLFQWFYPGADVGSRIGKPFLFVPWRPIRPARVWQRLLQERDGRLQALRERVQRFEVRENNVLVHADSGGSFRATRAWICGGTLQTAGLLDRSLGRVVSRESVSDHVLCYLGQVDRAAHPDVTAPQVERTVQGLWLAGSYDAAGSALITRRPARFQYRRLDFGIEQRAVFGLPTGGALAKILRGASPGLIAEALYNRAGLFPAARIQSVYAQLVVREAHWLPEGGNSIVMRKDVIRSATDAVRAGYTSPSLQPSGRPEVFLPMIHLHHSVDIAAVEDAGVNTPGSCVQIMDASVRDCIGPEHHSFKIMVAAFARARDTR
jgi:hypothetical protein